MPEILTIPAGVIMPKDLIMWLRDRRDEERAAGLTAVDDEYAEQCFVAASAFQEVLLHVQNG